MGLTWEKKVLWSSSPVDDQTSFDDYSKSSNGSKNINEQWNQLRNNLELQYDFR